MVEQAPGPAMRDGGSGMTELVWPGDVLTVARGERPASSLAAAHEQILAVAHIAVLAVAQREEGPA